MTSRTPSPTVVAATTGVTRDRYVDLLRVASLGTVILGHWLMITPVPDPRGGTRITNLLAVVPALQPTTWLFQIMPVFFLVGGFSQATAWASARRRGDGYAAFVRVRAHRLLRPTAVFVAVWLGIGLIADLAGADAGLTRTALRTVAQPLWFLGVYLAVVALAPATWRLHRRAGRRAALVPAGFFAAAALVDALRFAGPLPSVGYANVLLVWVGVHQLGYLYADGTLQRGGRRLGALLAGGGLAVVIVLTVPGPYPVSMVGVPGEPVSNMSPPTVALAAHAVWLTGLVLLLRAPLTRWLARERVWHSVIVANLLAMTAFLWHLTAAFVVIAVALSQPPAGAAPGSAQWWLLRPTWLVACAVVTGALVTVFRRFDGAAPAVGAADRPTLVRPRPDRIAAVGMAACALGLVGLSAVGFAGLLQGRSATLIGVPFTAPAAIALLTAGVVLVSGSGRQRSGSGGRPLSKVGTGRAAAGD